MDFKNINWKSTGLKALGLLAMVVGYAVDQCQEKERINQAVQEYCSAQLEEKEDEN